MKIRAGIRHGKSRWLLDTRLAGRRVREWFASKAAAEARAREIVGNTRAAGEFWQSLPPSRRAEFAAVAEEISAAGLSVGEVWRAYQAGTRAPVRVPSPALLVAVDACVAAKLAAGRSRAYCESLHGELRRFARGAEVRPVRDCTAAHLEDHLARCGPSPATRAGVLSKLSAFFTWAGRRGWCDRNPAAAVDAPTVPARAPRILSPAEAARLLAATPPRSLAWVVLGLFAGVRPAEADALRWEDCQLARGFAEVAAAVAKVRRRRIVPLCTAAVAWLDFARAHGATLPTVPASRRRDCRAARAAMGWNEWPADILRHSAASYLLARDRDAARVADALGHSPAVLFRHYRELVSPEDCAAFWSIRPPPPVSPGH